VSLHEDGSGAGGYAKEMSKEFIAAEMALFALQAKEVDIIITTALIPGKPAPVLITQEMVGSMRQGSVIVDMAAEAGGNCALTKPGEVTVKNGVTIIGYVDLPSRLAPTASQLYGSNLTHLLADMGGGLSWHVDLEDPVVRGALVLHEGELMWPPPAPPAPPIPPPKAPVVAPPSAHHATGHGKGKHGHREGVPAKSRPLRDAIVAAVVLGVLYLLGTVAPPALISHLTIFVLACFVGWQVVWNVTPALHTPLMSVTNAISGIILLGGMLQVSGPPSSAVTLLSAAAILLATINIVGGFTVTQRMLRMFKK